MGGLSTNLRVYLRDGTSRAGHVRFMGATINIRDLDIPLVDVVSIEYVSAEDKFLCQYRCARCDQPFRRGQMFTFIDGVKVHAVCPTEGQTCIERAHRIH